MTSNRNALLRLDANLEESVGVRPKGTKPHGIQPNPKDIGRRGDPEFGRIATHRLQPDPSQPRQVFDPDAIEQLSQSLQRSGQLAPIVARWCPQRAAWLIVAGERRWRAAQLAGMHDVACRFLDREKTKAETLELQLVENLLREDLRPIEEANGFRRLMGRHDYSGKQVAQALALPESKVSRSLALLKLPGDIQQQVDAGRISVRSAYELTKEPDPQRQRRLATQAASGNLRHDQINHLVSKRRRASKPRGIELTFTGNTGGVVKVRFKRTVTYDAVEAALVDALEEVRQRIDGRVRLL